MKETIRFQASVNVVATFAYMLPHLLPGPIRPGSIKGINICSIS